MEWLRRRRLSPIGLDVGTSGIKAIQLQFRADGARIVAAAASEWELGAETDPEARRQALAEAVRALLERHPFEGRRVVLALNADQVDIRPMVVPGSADDGMDEAVVNQVRKDFAFDPDASLLDYVEVEVVREGRDRRTKVLAVMASRDAVEHAVAWTRDAGLRCVALDAAPFALARLVSRLCAVEEREPLAILDLGATHATGVIMAGATLLSSRNIALGGETITKALMDGLELDHRTAEAFKCGVERSFHFTIAEGEDAGDEPGEQFTVQADRVLRDILWSRMEPLAQELSKLRSYCSAELRGAVPERVIPLGGGAYLDQLDDFLDHVGGFRTERHELSELLSEAAPPAMVAGEGVFAAGTLRHALAMGLALWGSPS